MQALLVVVASCLTSAFVSQNSTFEVPPSNARPSRHLLYQISQPHRVSLPSCSFGTGNAWLLATCRSSSTLRSTQSLFSDTKIGELSNNSATTTGEMSSRKCFCKSLNYVRASYKALLVTSLACSSLLRLSSACGW